MTINLTRDELEFCYSALNGVVPTIDIERRWESIRANIIAHSDYRYMPPTLPNKLNQLSFYECCCLWCAIRDFWELPDIC